MTEKQLIAIIRLRGEVNLEKDIKETMKFLKLRRVNHCVIVPKKPEIEGMAKRVKNYVTWGEPTNEMIEKIIYKRGRLPGDKRIDKKEVKKIARDIIDGKKVDIKPVFRLSPPSKGHRPIRIPYPKGAVGYRGEKINELLKRMI